jgi:hypothetical protein
MKYNILILSLVSIFVILNITCSAQTKSESKIYHIETVDGNSYNGEILTSDSTKILFKAEKLGEITVYRTYIKKMTPLKYFQVKNNKYWLENPQSTRYFISPNGYGLKGGEGYYQNIWVMMNSVAIGLNDYISVGGGVIPLFLIAGGPTPLWGTIKVSIPVTKDKFNLGAGVLAGGVISGSEFDNSASYGIFYGTATFGSRDNNLSLGAGYAFTNESHTSSPIINFDGMIRIGPHGYLISENYLFTDVTPFSMLLSVGGRSIFNSGGLDYGLVFPVGMDTGLFAIPWLGITIPIGKRK